MTSLCSLSLADISQLLQEGEVSSVELTRACLERIEAINPEVNCFLTVTADLALKQARRADSRIRSHAKGQPLLGIPLAYKDLFETRGVRTTAGSLVFRDYIPQEDAVVVRRLRTAGAVMLGKLNMHEIALGLTNVNPHYGACHNPWALDRITGGSSGGSAAAVSAGLCFGALGSDTGGSIRVPAALCGVVGLKPTRGRVSLRGVLPLSWNLDHVGPLGRRVADVALLFQHIAFYDSGDPYCINAPRPEVLKHLGEGIAGWRIALADDDHCRDVDPTVAGAIQAAAAVFTDLGASVTPLPLPELQQAARANPVIITSDGAAFHRQRMQDHLELFGEDIRRRLQTGAAYSSTDYALARHTQTLLKRKFEMLFADYDLLLTPTTRIPAPPIEGPDAIEQASQLTRFTAPFNLTGLPAISLPCGFSTEGLPIGMQLVAAPWAEARLLRAAYAFEQATNWHTIQNRYCRE